MVIYVCQIKIKMTYIINILWFNQLSSTFHFFFTCVTLHILYTFFYIHFLLQTRMWYIYIYNTVSHSFLMWYRDSVYFECDICRGLYHILQWVAKWMLNTYFWNSGEGLVQGGCSRSLSSTKSNWVWIYIYNAGLRHTLMIWTF